MSELPAILSLKTWLQEHSGEFHPDALFQQGPSGSRVVASKEIPADSTIVACPFDLVITQAIAKKNVLEIMGSSTDEKTIGWNERQWISTYISLHWIIDDEDSRFDAKNKLLHRKYLDTLPGPECLRTPLHFTSFELDLFKGSNLYGAARDRERDWKAEWSQCHDAISESDAYLGEHFIWEKYLAAATYLSSRAFPSSLLSPTPTLVHSPTTQPILIPGVDALNHARGQPVSWSVTFHNDKQTTDGTDSHQPTISLVIRSSTAEGEELFNNYGPKPNSELILGYGFSLPDNPDDTIVLKIGGIAGNKWEVGRNAQATEGLWKEILSTLSGAESQPPTYEDVLDASGMLGEMVEALIQRLPNPEVRSLEDIRPEVLTMFKHYIGGQRDVLSSLLDFSRTRAQDAVKMAREVGIELVLEEEED